MRAITNAALLATLLAAPCAWADETSETSTSQTVSPQQRTEIEKEVARQLAERETSQWKFGVLPDGGGFFAHSPDDYYQFRILGEAQTVGTLVDADFVNSFGNGDVSIRRARVGSYFRLKQKYASERRIGKKGVERPSLGGAVERDFFLGIEGLHEVQHGRPVGERGGPPGEGRGGARVGAHGGRGAERREARG